MKEEETRLSTPRLFWFRGFAVYSQQFKLQEERMSIIRIRKGGEFTLPVEFRKNIT